MDRVNPLHELARLGQSVWLDDLAHPLLDDGTLARLVHDDGVTGVTSNPAIFHKAIAAGGRYLQDLPALKAATPDPEQRYERLVIPDIRSACDVLRPVFERTGGDDGYVSLELSPKLAHDARASVEGAQRLRGAVARDNLLIKVPATQAGLEAIETLTEHAIGVNVTLMFSLAHVERVGEAYVRGLAKRFARGGDVSRIKSVASMFLSRIDTLVDDRLAALGSDAALALRGRAAVAVAKLAYQRYRARFLASGFAELATAGARRQFLLWGSTGTKNAAYSDLLYVEPVIGAETVNTMPMATLSAFRDHGRAAPTLERGLDEAAVQLRALASFGIDLDACGETLQAEGLRRFDEAYDALIGLVR